MTTSRKLRMFSAVSIAFALLAASCGGSDDGDADEPAPDATEAPTDDGTAGDDESSDGDDEPAETAAPTTVAPEVEVSDDGPVRGASSSTAWRPTRPTRGRHTASAARSAA